VLAGLLALAPVAPAAPPTPDAATKEHARQLFDTGNARLSAGETEAALSAFLESRTLFPTRGNTLNAALLLHRLGRHDEALELFLSLSKDFTQSASEKEQVDGEIARLKELTGRLEVTTEPGATIAVDGRTRGAAPLGEPLIVLSGRRAVRVTAPGRAPFETTVLVYATQTARVTAPLEPEGPVQPSPAPPPVPPPPVPQTTPPGGDAPTEPQSGAHVSTGPNVVLGVSVGPAIGTGFGGPLADSCGAGCSTHAPFGVFGIARGGLRLASGFDLSLEIGWTRLSGRYEGRDDVLVPQGSGPQEGTATDSITWSGTLVGAHGGWSRGEHVTFRLGLGAGIAFASVTDHRQGQYPVTPPTGAPYVAYVDDEHTAKAHYLYVTPEIGVGFLLSSAVELHADLGVFTAIALTEPLYNGSEGVVVKNANGDSELAYLKDEALTGTPFFVFVPQLGITIRP
jgi:hypothetical protein